MDTSFVAREQTRLLGELSEFLSIPSVSALPAHAADCRRAAEWLRDELTRPRLPDGGAHRGRRASRGLGGEPARARPARPCSSTGTTTSSPPTRSRSGSPRRSSPPCATAASMRAERPTTRARSSACSRPTRRRWTPTGGRRSTCASSSRARRSPAGRSSPTCCGRSPSAPGSTPSLVCDIVILRARDARGLHRASRASATPRSRSARAQRDLHSGTLRRRRAQRDRDAGPHPRGAQGRRRRDPESPSSTRRSSRPPSRSSRPGRSCRSTRRPTSARKSPAKALTGLKEYSVFERIWALPTFEIHGIRGGFVGEGAKTVIPAQATAKVSLRLVPGQSYEKVGRQLERAVAKLAPKWADVKVTLLHGGDPVQVDVSAPVFDVLDEAFESGHRAGPRSGSGPADPSPSCRSLDSPARRWCSPASGSPMTGCIPPTRSWTWPSSGAVSRSSDGSSSCSRKRGAAGSRPGRARNGGRGRVGEAGVEQAAPQPA